MRARRPALYRRKAFAALWPVFTLGCNLLLGNEAWRPEADASTPYGSGAGPGLDGSLAGDGAAPGDGSLAPDGALGADSAAAGDAPVALDGWVDGGPSDASDAASVDAPPPPHCTGNVCSLATGQPGPYALAVDATRVYFTNQGLVPELDGGSPDADLGTGSVASVPIDGGAVSVLASSLHGPRDILVDTSNVTWVSHDSPTPMDGYGSVASVPKQGGAVSFVQQGIADDVHALATYEGNFVWASQGLVYELLGPPSGLIHLAEGAYDIGGVAADGTGVYVTIGDYGVAPAVISIVDIGGGGLDTRTTTLYTYAEPEALGPAAIDDTNIYYLDATTGTVNALAKDGSPPTVLASGQVNAVAVAVDAAFGYVYWTTEGTPATSYTDGTVMKVQTTGGGLPVPLVQGQPRPHGIAVDAANVYWTNLGDGTVMARSK